jgi:hypothetical protein
MARVGMFPNTPESKALRKATLAVIATDRDMTEADLWAFGQDAIGLLDAFAWQQLTERYRQEDLRIVATRLDGVVS